MDEARIKGASPQAKIVHNEPESLRTDQALSLVLLWGLIFLIARHLLSRAVKDAMRKPMRDAPADRG